MKLLIAILALTAISAFAQLQTLDGTTPHTNNYTTAAQITVPAKGWTNEPYSTSNYVSVSYGDPWSTAAAKLNSMFNYLFNRLGTNPPIAFTNTITLPAGSSATVTNLGIYINGIAYYQIGVPQGLPGTNFVTVNQFTNVMLSSYRYISYSTNNITWSTSNFLARVDGLLDFNYDFGTLGAGGLSPGTNVDGALYGSYDGSTAWFELTNGFTTTNTISVSASGAGGGVGFATLYNIDHPELAGRTNYFDLQFVGSQVSPTYGWQFVNKSYVDTAVANVRDGNWVSYTDMNQWFHFYYSRDNNIIFDMASQSLYAPINGFSRSGTNLLMTVTQTNIANGYTVLSSTNLALGSAGFLTFTNYTAATNTGIVTFTIPISFSDPALFFRVRISSSSSSSAFYVPVTFNLPLIVNSNAWASAYQAITNSANMSFGLASSNGVPVKWFWSNSVVVISPWVP